VNDRQRDSEPNQTFNNLQVGFERKYGLSKGKNREVFQRESLSQQYSIFCMIEKLSQFNRLQCLCLIE